MKKSTKIFKFWKNLWKSTKNDWINDEYDEYDEYEYDDEYEIKNFLRFI